MSERRRERHRLQRRLLLVRAMERLEQQGFESLDAASLAGEADLAVRSLGVLDAEEIFFPQHQETLTLLEEMLERVGLAEACLALARHRQEDADCELRRLAHMEAQPRLQARQALKDQELFEVFLKHFTRWDEAGPKGERSAAFQASALLAVLHRAERLWLEGD